MYISITNYILALGEKLADVKIKNAATECLLDFTEATCPQFVFSQLYQATAGHKNPKVTSEALVWMVKALEDFGIGSIGIHKRSPVFK